MRLCKVRAYEECPYGHSSPQASIIPRRMQALTKCLWLTKIMSSQQELLGAGSRLVNPPSPSLLGWHCWMFTSVTDCHSLGVPWLDKMGEETRLAEAKGPKASQLTCACITLSGEKKYVLAAKTKHLLTQPLLGTRE